jgi:uncharacterized membrane-anchored protein
MRFIAGLCLAALCGFAAVPASADMGSYPRTEEEVQKAYDRLNWLTKTGSYTLPESHAVIRLRAGRMLLVGNDAQRYEWLNSGTESSETEGYVSDADWADVNADELLQVYRAGAEAGNDERIDKGIEPMHVVGWLEKPRYDKATHTVTYAMELKDKNGSWANAFALRLGRAGYTEFTWVGSIGLFQSAGGRPALLNEALAAHSFEEGHRYVDFKAGDAVAAVAIAGLVRTAISGRSGNGGAGLLKFIIPTVLVAGAAVARFGRRLLGGDS